MLLPSITLQNSTIERIWHRTCIRVIVIKNLFKTSKGDKNETTNKQRT